MQLSHTVMYCPAFIAFGDFTKEAVEMGASCYAKIHL